MKVLYRDPSDRIALKNNECRNAYYCPPITDLDYNLPISFAKLIIRQTLDKIDYPSSYMPVELSVVTEGSVVLNIYQNEYLVKAGQGFVVMPGTANSFRSADGKPYTIYQISLEGSLKNDFFKYKNTVFTVLDLNKFLDLFYKLATYPLCDEWSYICSELVYSFLIRLDKIFAFPEDPKYTSLIKLDKIVQHIRTHLDEPYDANQLADLINVSTSYMCRLFKQVYGLKPSEFSTSIRIAEAQNILSSDQSITIKEVARKVGYEDANYFGVVFKKHVGVTPKTWQFGNPNLKK